jgi:Domain of unknown function (DUF3387)
MTCDGISATKKALEPGAAIPRSCLRRTGVISVNESTPSFARYIGIDYSGTVAKDMRKAGERGESLGLNEDETAFYDALGVNDSAVQVLGEPTLKKMARELVIAVKNNVTIDWTVRENVRANLRVIVKRILRKYGYPPDKQERATQTVLEQAEALSEGWAAA